MKQSIKFCCLLLFAISAIRCGKFKEPSGAGLTTLILPSYYLGICETLGSLGESDITVEVFIDGTDGEGNILMLNTQEFERTTNTLDPDNLNFEIEIPELGSYFIQVIVRGEECISCCNDTNEPNLGCNQFEGGEIRMRGISITGNAMDLKPTVVVLPQLYSCNCGC